MGSAASVLVLGILASFPAAADPNRAPERPPTVLASEGSGVPEVEHFAAAHPYLLGEASFRFLWTSSGLHVYAVVVDDEINASITGGDDPATAGEDSIEILVDARPGQLDPAAATRVVVSAAGGVYDTRGVGAAEDAAIDPSIVTVDSADGWTALVTIDAASAELEIEPNAVLGIDFALRDVDAAGTVVDDWSGLADTAQLECWSRVQLVGPGDPRAQDCIGRYHIVGDRCLEESSGCAIGGAGPAGAAPLGVLLLLLRSRARPRRDRHRALSDSPRLR